MEHTRTRKPSFGKSKAASPIEAALLTTPPERYPPEAKHPVPENTETIKIPRDGVVVEIALQDRPEPFAGLWHEIVHTLTKLLFDFLQLLPHTLADRRTPHHK
jgi:hypothetical protein